MLSHARVMDRVMRFFRVTHALVGQNNRLAMRRRRCVQLIECPGVRGQDAGVFTAGEIGEPMASIG